MKWNITKPTRSNETAATAYLPIGQIDIDFPMDLPNNMQDRAHVFVGLHIWLPVKKVSTILSGAHEDRVKATAAVCVQAEKQVHAQVDKLLTLFNAEPEFISAGEVVTVDELAE